MEVIDQPFIKTNENIIKYGGFWSRFGAAIIDSLILAPLWFGVTYFNVITWKSPLLLVVSTLVTVAYKPLLEFLYGATWGKMALKLKVVNLQFESPTPGEILLRNIFHITPSLVTLFFTIGVYADPEFESISGFPEYTSFAQKFIILRIISFASVFITIVDAIILLADKQNRSLHDKIGQTLVIEQS